MYKSAKTIVLPVKIIVEKSVMKIFVKMTKFIRLMQVRRYFYRKHRMLDRHEYVWNRLVRSCLRLDFHPLANLLKCAISMPFYAIKKVSKPIESHENLI